MTMHLMRGLSTLNTRKPTIKMTKARLAKWKEDWQLDSKWRKQAGMPKLTFDQYCDYVTGKVKHPKPKFKELKVSANYRTLDNHRIKYPSRPMTSGDAPKKESMQYSGERTLLGIAVMHKSNLVPVFSTEEATDISRMRRG